jgi:hypothetical protein
VVRTVKLWDAFNITNPLALFVYFGKLEKATREVFFFVAFVCFFSAFASEISFFNID